MDTTMSKVLETSKGFVFESADGSLLRAEYEAYSYSITGPTWRVSELDFADSPTVYNDYATETGRAYRRNNPVGWQ